jgi:tripartite motif-containing protein 71
MHSITGRRPITLLATLASAAALALVVQPSIAGASACPGADPCPWTHADTFGDVGDGEFRAPYDAAVDAAGNLYVVENDTNRVQKLDATGAFVAKWGGVGTAEGQFEYPEDIAVDAAHDAVYVADTESNRIQKFGTDGHFISAWGWGVDDGGSAYQICTSTCRAGAPGAGNGAMNSPRGVASDGTNVYVADWDNKRVEKFDLEGNYVASWTIGSPQQKPLRIAVANGNVYVTTFSGAVWRFDTGGVPDPTWDGDGTTGTIGTGAGQLDYPVAMAVDGNGVYVVDSNNQRIVQFGLNGAFVRAWGWGVDDGTAALQTCTSSCQHGIEGAGAGQFDDPYGIVATGGKLWVADAYNHRLQQFTPTGGYTATVGGPPAGGKFYFPADVAVAPSGDVYVADYSDRRVQRLSSTGGFVSMWSTDYPISVTPTSGGVYATWLSNRVRRFGADGTLLGEWGTFGSNPGQFDGSYGTAADAAGNIYVAERGNSRVQKFDPSGTFLATIGSAGSGDGQLKGPLDVTLDAAGNLYVADTGNNRVEKFDSTGAFVKAWGTAGSAAGQFETPSGVVVDQGGRVFVSDRGNDRIQQFDGDGHFISAWGAAGDGPGELSWPGGITVDGAGAVWVADSDNHRIVRFCCPGAAGQSDPGSGSGGAAAATPGPASGAADTVAPHIALGGRHRQRSGTVRRRGLGIRIGSDEATKFNVTVALSRREARRLGLRVTIGRATVDLSAAGTRTMRIRLGASARRALARRGLRTVRVVVRAAAVDRAGNRSTASLAVTINR